MRINDAVLSAVPGGVLGALFGPVLGSMLILAAASPVLSAVGADQPPTTALADVTKIAPKLGDSLTPIGAEKAGNKDGTIPAWDGGLVLKEMHRDDNPFAEDKPSYTITAANYKQYADQLAEGYKALFQTYPDYKMIVYPTRRSAAYPQWFYDATKRNATAVKLTDNGAGFCCAAQGYPFPIPQDGTEVLWNHVMRYNTRGYRGYLDSAETQADGSALIQRAYCEISYIYNNPKTTLASLNNQNVDAMVKIMAPPNKAGTADMVHVPIDRVKEATGVWEYVLALGRVRRIGEVGYDNPLFDGLMTQDQLDMFNGPLDRYSIKLLGKKEMLVPYNSYAIYSNKLKYKDIVRPGHINQELSRYELHRVWVIEADLREGLSHVYKKRVFYLDEDSWLILAEDMYDMRDQFWRFAEAYEVSFAQVPVVVSGMQVHYDLQSRRYVAVNLSNEEPQAIEYDWDKDASYFTPQQLEKFASAGK